MLNGRDEKFAGQDESEYHFSEDDISYEVEPESNKPASTERSGSLKENFLNRLTRSKRMIISFVVFIVLVFITYKMVAPTSTTPSTDITSAPVQPSPPPVATTGKTPSPPSKLQPVAEPATPVVPPSAAQPANPALAGGTPAVAVSSSRTESQPSQVPVMQPGVPLPSTPSPQVASYPQPQQSSAPQSNHSAVAGMPAVIPVQAPANNQYAYPNQSAAAPVQAPVETGVNNLSAASERLADQLQLEYTQKINDFVSQNKALQEQVQTLNTRVANMELQLNQLVQALIRQNEGPSSASAMEPPAQSQASNPRIAYTVQAIIPGRAWLKADNGETLTVAEGDVIKDLGRVTKIDPYDGVVEVNTGSKVVSLSYGSSG